MNKSIERQRFEKVAARRVQNILDNMESLSKCANRYVYEYDEKDIKSMMHAIKEKIKHLETSFTQQTLKNNKNTFKF